MRISGFHLVALPMLAMLLGGCQSTTPVAKPTPSPGSPLRDEYRRPRNPYFLPRPILVLESAEMRRLAAAETGGGEPRWYESRNDAQLTVHAGYQSSTLETVYTRTYDHQYQHGNQVRDHYSKWTRTGSVKETVR